MSDGIKGTFRSVTGDELDRMLWNADGEARGVVQLVHGMSEHIARYDATAKALNAAGYVVVGHTHLGHGDKAGTQGYFAEKNGWDALIEDVHTLRQDTQKRFPTLPYFLLGHSMGSFVTRTYCLKHEDGLAGVVLSGTGHFAPAVVGFALTVAKLQCAFGGAKKPSHLLETMSSSSNNKEWSPARTPFDWLSRDEEVVDAYVADPYCGFTFTAGAYRDMFTGLKRLYPQNLCAMRKDVPILLLSGESDPVGQRGAGVRITAEELIAAGVEDVTFKLYPQGRHEMFNEPEREQVWAELIEWLNARIEKRA